MFVGDEQAGVMKSNEDGSAFHEAGKIQMETGARILPHFTRDNTDRNRTSPFAFTGNKFEFRMPGSSISVANANIVLNTAVAETLRRTADALEGVPAEELDQAVHQYIREELVAHKRILFNGNGYTDEWVEEAQRRGLDNLRSLPEAMPRWISDKSIALFTGHGIFSKEEIYSRYEILLENYSKTVHIESLTLQEMVRKDFTAGLVSYLKELTQEASLKKALVPDAGMSLEESLIRELSADAASMQACLQKLADDTRRAEQIGDGLAQAAFYEETVLKDMEALRAVVDAAERKIPDSFLPYPTYGDILFSLR